MVTTFKSQWLKIVISFWAAPSAAPYRRRAPCCTSKSGMFPPLMGHRREHAGKSSKQGFPIRHDTWDLHSHLNGQKKSHGRITWRVLPCAWKWRRPTSQGTGPRLYRYAPTTYSATHFPVNSILSDVNMMRSTSFLVLLDVFVQALVLSLPLFLFRCVYDKVWN